MLSISVQATIFLMVRLAIHRYEQATTPSMLARVMTLFMPGVWATKKLMLEEETTL